MPAAFAKANPTKTTKTRLPGRAHGPANTPSPAAARTASAPLVIVRTVADRQVIVALCGAAQAAGIRAGMTLTQARALCARVQHAEHEPRRDLRALEALGRWLMRFTPVVAPAQPHGIFLDVTGCEHLFGGLENLVGQVRAAMAGFAIAARVAAAPTPGAAWALAAAGADGAIAREENVQSVLAPLPPAALRLSDGLAAALHHLGLGTIGQVAQLPRDMLPARFGDELLHRLDQALGRIAEPLVPLEHHAPVEAKMDFDGMVSSIEALWAVGRHLLGQIAGQLSRRGCAARRLDIDLLRPSGPPLRKTILFSQPSGDPAGIFNLFRCALEEVGSACADAEHANSQLMPAPARGPRVERVGFALANAERVDGPTAFAEANPTKSTNSAHSPDSTCHPRAAPSFSPVFYDCGFIGMRLSVPLLQRIGHEQVFLLEQERQCGQLELGRLIDRLRLRLGERAVSRVELAQSHLPERAWKAGEIGEEEGNVQKAKDKKPIKESTEYGSGGLAGSPLPLRPLRLLCSPRQVPVMVTPCDDAQGKPAAFSHAGRTHQIAHLAGPERIAGCWWEGRDKTRDYCEVEDSAGRRFWIFRVTQTHKWYLHGTYE